MQENIKDPKVEEAIKITHEHERFFNKLEEIERTYKSALRENEKEHNEFYRRLNEKDIQDAVTRAQLDTVVKTTARIEQKIDEQGKVPKERWDKIITACVTAVATAIVTALIALIIK